MTIRFLKDWDLYPNAIPDLKTKNTSFLVLVKTYMKMGIQNHAFPLQLNQPELQGLDPYSEDLTGEQMIKILAETKYNLWYYLREVSRIPVPGAEEDSPFLANRANIALAWAFMCNIDIVIIMPRQCGKSVGTDVIMTWIVHIAAKKTDVQLITKDAKLRVKNIRRLKGFRDALPKWMVKQIERVDADNSEVMTNVTLENNYLTAVARSDKEAADNVGRGMTSPILHSDETPYCINIDISLPVALSSGTNARTLAEENGTFYGNIFTTTAGKQDTKEGKFSYAIFNDGVFWEERYMDCIDKADLKETIRTNRAGDSYIFNGTFSAMQVGKTREWLRDAIINSRGSREASMRDYLNVWTAGGTSSPLEVNVLEAIRQAARTPEYVERTKDRYLIKWQSSERELQRKLRGGPVLLCLDSSNAVGKDANGIVFIDATNMEVIGAAEIKTANILQLSKWIADMLILFPNMTFVFENKSSGQSICDAVALILIKHGINPFQRIFNRFVDDKATNLNNWDKVIGDGVQVNEINYEKHKGKFGFMTTGEGRKLLYGQVLTKAACSTGHLVRDETLSKQIRELEEKNGRVDHPDNGNDDLVIAWLLGHWFALFAKNLSTYGIPKNSVYSKVIDNATIMSDDANYDNAKYKAIQDAKNKIETLKELLANTTSQVIKDSILQRIATIVRSLPDESLDDSNIMEDIMSAGKVQTKDKPKMTLTEKFKKFGWL